MNTQRLQEMERAAYIEGRKTEAWSLGLIVDLAVDVDGLDLEDILDLQKSVGLLTKENDDLINRIAELEDREVE